MTAQRLQEAALARFAQLGFEATTMAQIAADVGIKKPSIYAHFRNKDELYLSLIPLMIEAELDHVRAALVGPRSIRKKLHGYLLGIQSRFDASFRVQFWMRALYTPPEHLYAQVMAPMHAFMAELEAILKLSIQQSELLPNAHRLSADVLAKTCMSLIDSLQVELLYGGQEKFRLRLKAVWAVFDAATQPGQPAAATA